MAERLSPWEAGWRDGADDPPITDPVVLDQLATLMRPAVATGASSDASLGAAESTTRPGTGSHTGRSTPATKNAPDHAGKRAVGGVS